MNEFGSPPDDDESEERSAIEIDLYGIKAKARPGKSSERPATWREVASRLNGHLMAICERLLGVIADTFVAAGNLVRGIGAVPDAIARRIAGAHDKADRLECKRQAVTIESEVLVTTTEISVAAIEQDPKATILDLLECFRARGAHVELSWRKDGICVIVILDPDLAETGKTLLENSHPAKAGSDNDVKLIQAALAKSSTNALRRIEVVCRNNDIALRGRVDSFYHKQMAIEMARVATNFKREILDEVEVVYRKSGDQPQAGDSW